MGRGMNYTSGESGSIGLGQLGSVYSDGTSITGISQGVVVAITMLTSTTFTALTPETTDFLEVGSTGYEALGDTLANSDAFPAGVTIYGRWTTVDVNAGSIIAYIG